MSATGGEGWGRRTEGGETGEGGAKILRNDREWGAWRPARRIAKRPGRIENKRSKEGGVGEEEEKEEGK